MSDDDMIDWDAAERVANKYGLTLGEVQAAAYALFDHEESHRGISGQVVRAMSARHVMAAIKALAAARMHRSAKGQSVE